MYSKDEGTMTQQEHDLIEARKWGMKIGEEIGIEKGQKIGIKKGREDALIQCACAYISKTGGTIEQAAEIFGLTEDQAEAVKKALC